MNSDVAALQAQAESAYTRGDLPNAVRLARAVLASAPNYAPAHLLLAGIALAGRQLRLATRDALRALDHAHGQPIRFVSALILRLISVGEYGAAFDALRRIDRSQPIPPRVLFDLSQQLTLLEQHEAALEWLALAVQRGGDSHATAYFRGNAFKFMGRMAEAETAFEDSIRMKPDYAYAHWALAFLGRKAGGESRVARLRDLIASTALPDGDRCYLDYALYRELEMLGDDAGAWSAVSQGAAAKRRTIVHDAAAESALFDEIAHRFPSVPPAFAAHGDAPTPVFIVGMPRTGTTLLERILGNAPGIALCGELNDLRMQYKWATDYYCPGYFDREALARSGAADYAQIGRRYLDHVGWRTPGARLFTDKSPGNFQMIGVILKALPQAKIIHLCRDPMDACFSNFKELFAASAFPYSYDLGELAAHHRSYTRLMSHWHRIAPGRILDVRYEDLVTDPESQTERVMRELGLPYQPGLSRVEDSTHIVSTASSAQVREPIHRRNIGGWRRYAPQLEPLRAALAAD